MAPPAVAVRALAASLGRWMGALFIAALPVLVLQAQQPESAAPSALGIAITSPLGRTGMSGPIRIVARISQVPGSTLSPVQFFVEGQLVGEDRDGAPYAVEWRDDNPFLPVRIAVQVADSLGTTASDTITLEPLEFIERESVSAVVLEPSVRDDRGRPVNGLTAVDFTVTEDGNPQDFDMVATDHVPASYTLLIDSSQSMSRRLDFVRAAARQLLSRLREDDRVTVVPFAAGLGTVTGPTLDRDTIDQAIRAIQAGGSTAILDALVAAVRELRGSDARQIVVLITDGYDESSRISFEEAMEAVKASKVTVYVVGISGVAGISLKGEDLLQRLAASTGGRAFFPSREFQLTDVQDLIAADVQQRYVLTYTPTNQQPDGLWREVTVRTPDPTHVVTVRSGYTAPAPPPIRPQIELTIRDLNRQHLDVTPADFEVYEDGVLQSVEGFEEALTPINLVLVLDQSGSMRRDAPAVMEAARAFARQMPGKDRVGVILFADRPVLVQDLSTIREFVLRAIDRYTASGGTALYDALMASLERLKRTEGRTAIVVLTDGRDENNPGTAPGSTHTLDDVVAALDEVGTTIYAVGLGPNVDRTTLERLASVSGGEVYFSADVTTLGEHYRRIVENLRRRYVISYTSTNNRHDGRWRTVEIKPSREGIAIESTAGYFAPVLD